PAVMIDSTRNLARRAGRRPLFQGRQVCPGASNDCLRLPIHTTMRHVMPILPRELDLYPGDLLETADSADSTSGQWWVYYTLSRREKDLMRRLHTLSVPFFCPLVPQKSRSSSGRVRTSYVPLFPGYVFSKATDEQRQLALTTNCISRTLQVAESDELINDLRQIRQLIEANSPLTAEARIQAGTLVRVKNGPLAGVDRVVIKRHSVHHLLVSIRFLQQGASVALEDFLVEPV
ncbi:MAG: UpxY family transcription antiterminator, partial [Planctomycetales bacterium]|nr:UpxY family transcription antiterminator [Planctomycetales bacterium]